jgi:hypothetical protein
MSKKNIQRRLLTPQQMTGQEKKKNLKLNAYSKSDENKLKKYFFKNLLTAIIMGCIRSEKPLLPTRNLEDICWIFLMENIL